MYSAKKMSIDSAATEERMLRRAERSSPLVRAPLPLARMISSRAV
jgi:hypothetical protein